MANATRTQPAPFTGSGGEWLDALPARPAARQTPAEASAVLWRMTTEERVAAMRANPLNYQQLLEWTQRRPDEVPRLGREFEWLASLDPANGAD
jgi:hypothetical protein